MIIDPFLAALVVWMRYMPIIPFYKGISSDLEAIVEKKYRVVILP